MGKMFDVDEIRKALETSMPSHTLLQPCEVVQQAIDYLMHDVTWNDYLDDYYHVWYYAEGEMYVIRDVMVDTFAFIKAESPKEAYEKYMKRWNEAMKAGELEEEEMGRLIDTDKLKAHYAWWKDGTREMTMAEAKDIFDEIVDLQPTAERHAHWEWDDELGANVCSSCGRPTYDSHDECVDFMGSKVIALVSPYYCGYCGAKMDEVKE